MDTPIGMEVLIALESLFVETKSGAHRNKREPLAINTTNTQNNIFSNE